VRNSKFLLIFFWFAIILVSAPSGATPDERLKWHSDLTKAYEISKSTNKPIFAFFTGSDWCGWCHKLQRDVFAKEEFITWAEKNVILVELDFPRRKQLPPALVDQNNSLQQAFGVRGYPTIWIFDLYKDETTKNFNIQALGSLGYPGGAEVGKEEIKFLKEAKLLMANRKSSVP
jgi:thioredoxin-related protein